MEHAGLSSVEEDERRAGADGTRVLFWAFSWLPGIVGEDTWEGNCSIQTFTASFVSLTHIPTIHLPNTSCPRGFLESHLGPISRVTRSQGSPVGLVNEIWSVTRVWFSLLSSSRLHSRFWVSMYTFIIWPGDALNAWPVVEMGMFGAT